MQNKRAKAVKNFSLCDELGGGIDKKREHTRAHPPTRAAARVFGPRPRYGMRTACWRGGERAELFTSERISTLTSDCDT